MSNGTIVINAPTHATTMEQGIDMARVMRYIYLGDALTDPALVNMPCDPVRRADGKCIVSVPMATALVQDAQGRCYVVKRRRLRLTEKVVGNA